MFRLQELEFERVFKALCILKALNPTPFESERLGAPLQGSALSPAVPVEGDALDFVKCASSGL